MFLHATLTHLLNTSRVDDSTPSLGSLFMFRGLHPAPKEMYFCTTDYMVLEMIMGRRKKSTGLEHKDVFLNPVLECVKQKGMQHSDINGHHWVVKTKCYKS